VELVTKDSSITQVLEDFGNEVLKKFQTNLKKDKAIASGELFQSMNFSAKIMGQKFHFVLDMGVDYWEAVDKGRRAGKQPPMNNLIKWVNQKATFGGFSNVKDIHKVSTQRGLAYVIARKIGKRGSKGNSFYSKVITDKRLKQLKRDLATAGASDLQTIIQQTARGIQNT
jgi:hypothetical protein